MSTSSNFYSPLQCLLHYGMRRSIQGITIHWWGDPASNPTFEGTVAYLCRPGGNTSAHTVIEAGRWDDIIDPANAAWHAGSRVGNATTIGLECNPRASDGDYDQIALKIRQLRAQYGDLPLYPHKHWFNTACPGVYDLNRLDALARGATPVVNPIPAPVPTPAPAPVSDPTVLRNQQLLNKFGYGLAEDGILGPVTLGAIKDFQAKHGLVADGIVGPLTLAALQGNPAPAPAPDQLDVDGVFGPKTKVWLQRALGVAQDGIVGPDTIRALQGRVGASADGSWGPLTTKALQRYLGVGQDGVFGPITCAQLQRRLNAGSF
jgi:peptidoglycan hydrolase-like protein with peptidoglycan-binding domain